MTLNFFAKKIKLSNCELFKVPGNVSDFITEVIKESTIILHALKSA
jgi:hypothetical protein